MMKKILFFTHKVPISKGLSEQKKTLILKGMEMSFDMRRRQNYHSFRHKRCDDDELMNTTNS